MSNLPTVVDRDGFMTYDELSGPELDAARWTPARLPVPTGGEHIPLDRNADVAVSRCEITLDRSRSKAAWRVDGQRVYEARGTFIPERVRIAFGIWTMLPIRDGRSRSLQGQGVNARWRRFRVRGVDTSGRHTRLHRRR